MAQVILRVGGAVPQEGLHVGPALPVVRCLDDQRTAVLQVQGGLAEQGSAQDIFVRARTNGIEAQGGEHIPGGGLSVVLVAAIPVGRGAVHTLHHLTQPILGFPRTAGIVVQVDGVLYGLVAVGVIAHIHHGHLAYLVDDLSVIAFIEQGRHGEHRVQHLHESLLASHQVYQALRVVEDRPGVVPVVSLGEGIAPLQRRERRLEGAVLVAAPHQAALLVEHIPIVQRPLGEKFLFLLRTVQSLGHPVDAPVIVGILQRAGHVLVDTYIVGDIAQFIIILVSQAARGRDFGMNIFRPVQQSFVQGLHIIHPHTLEPRIGQDGDGIIAHHTTPVARTGPFGKEAALPVGIKEAFLHLTVHRGIHQIEQGEQTTEGIPKAGVGVQIAGQDLTIIWTVMHGLSLRIAFIERTGEEQRAIQAGVERAQLIQRATVHLYPTQYLVPGFAPFCHQLVERLTAQLLQVALRLLPADERGCHPGVNHLSLAGAEADDGTGMSGLLLQPAFRQHAVGHGSAVGERLVELHHEVVLEVGGHSAAVACAIAHNAIVLRLNPDVRAAVEGIDHHIGPLTLGEGEAEQRRPLRGREFGEDVIIGQVDLVIMRLSHLAFVGKPTGPLVLIELRPPRHRHQGELPIVIDPRAGLMRLLEAADFMGGVDILPTVAHPPRLRRPEVHAPRAGHGRIGISRRQLKTGQGAHQRIDILHPVAGLQRGRTQPHGYPCYQFCSHK